MYSICNWELHPLEGGLMETIEVCHTFVLPFTHGSFHAPFPPSPCHTDVYIIYFDPPLM